MEVQDNFGMPALAFPSAVQRIYPNALDLDIPRGPDWQFREASAILGRVTGGNGDDGAAPFDRAISLLRSVASTTPHDDPSRLSALLRLSEAFGLRFTLAKDPADQDEAVNTAHTAAAEYPATPAMFNRLAIALGDRGGDRGDLNDLDGSVAAAQRAVEMTAADDPNYVPFLANLGSALGNRYDHSSTTADLDGCLKAYQAAADAAPDDHPGRPGFLERISPGPTTAGE
jgi:hypothetical protein